MTIYRRKLASSFHALQRTLEKRLTGVAGMGTETEERRLDEDIADRAEAGEEIDAEGAAEEDRKALAYEEMAVIEEIVRAISGLPAEDSKARELQEVLSELDEAGHRQAMAFTQFTDTLDYLRDYLVGQGRGRIMCFSGRGGEVPASGGTWKRVTREKVKRRFRDGDADILVCTDAAAEGLNFQFCGALVDYDMPWNPMRVEQRIGRIDRLGQQFPSIRIINLHYADTVEADVYRTLRERIAVFENVVGRLQPILTRLPSLIEEAALASAKDSASEDAVGTLEQAIRDTEGQAVDINVFANQNLEMPPQQPPPSNAHGPRQHTSASRAVPPGIWVRPLGTKDFSYGSGELDESVRVTIDREFYEDHTDSVEFWAPGSPVFPDLRPYRDQGA